MDPRRWRYGYAWLTLGFFLVSIVGHWVFGWFTYVDEQLAHDQPIVLSGFVVQIMRDTLENWQSEFLQLLWQVGGLAILLHIGSPQSKEGNDRLEEKVDALLRRVDPDNGPRIIAELDEKFARQPEEPPLHKFGQPERG
jgi:hypothetical protein